MTLNLKVLHVYSGNMFGGVETLLVTLARSRSLCPQMQPYFALCFEGRLAAELRATGVGVYMLGKVRASQLWTVWQARLKLARLLRKEKFDVIMCHSCWPQAIFGSVVRNHQLPLVFWCHDTPAGKHWLERWATLSPPTLALANSQYTLAALPNLYPGIRSEILYLPVPRPEIGDRAEVRQAVRGELNTPDDAIVIIQASRLERWKGQKLLLSALGELREESAWRCWIAGGDQRPHELAYLQELQAQTQQLGIAGRVQFLGQRADVPRLLAAADIHCQPNTGPEAFGIAFVEALYAGLPVVTTAMGGGMEIVDESCGRLVAPDDAISISCEDRYTSTPATIVIIPHSSRDCLLHPNENRYKALSEVLRSLITNSAEREKLAAHGPKRADQLCNPARQLSRLHDLLSGLVM